MSNILSIQSAVSYGHVGNSAAVFPLQRIGHEVWPVYTVNYSNHTGYGSWKGPMIPATEVAAIIDGIEERGALPRVDAILSGYQGGDDIADVIIDTVARVKAVNPDAIYACDPVMGSAKSGCFVSDNIPPLLRDRVVPVADLITPNQFELGYLVEQDVTDLDSTLCAVDAAREMGPSTVLVTSVERADAPADTIEMIAVDDHGKWIVRAPHACHSNATAPATSPQPSSPATTCAAATPPTPWPRPPAPSTTYSSAPTTPTPPSSCSSSPRTPTPTLSCSSRSRRSSRFRRRFSHASTSILLKACD